MKLVHNQPTKEHMDQQGHKRHPANDLVLELALQEEMKGQVKRIGEVEGYQPHGNQPCQLSYLWRLSKELQDWCGKEKKRQKHNPCDEKNHP